MSHRSAWDELRAARRGRRLVRFIYRDSGTQTFIEPTPQQTHFEDGDTFIVPEPPPEQRLAVIEDYDRRWYGR